MEEMMRFECGPGWFKANGFPAEPDKQETLVFKFDPHGGFRLTSMKREKENKPLYVFCKNEEWDEG
jgi:hypothetical protein